MIGPRAASGDLASAEVPSCEADEGCITCGDVASELEVITVDAARGLALCADAHGRRETVVVALVGPVEAGRRLLVHAGTAIASLDTGGRG